VWCDGWILAFVSTNFHCSPLRFEFVRPYNSSFVENFRTVVGYHTYKYTRHTRALSIAVDFQPAALRLSKYRLALRATLLVWPRTSHNFSWSLYPIRLFAFFCPVVSSPSFYRLRRETHPTLGIPWGESTSFHSSNVFQATPSPCRAPMLQKYGSILASPRLKVIACTLVQANRRRSNHR